MTQEERKALITILIVVLIGTGLAWAGSQGGVGVFSLPLFALSVLVAFVIQWLVFIPAFVFQSEKFFDLTGSLTYTGVTVMAWWLSGKDDPRSLLLLIMVLIWAGRLGSFLFRRVLNAGKDGRFDDIKPHFFRFLQTWTLQGLWVSFTLAAALAAITSIVRVEMGVFTWLGFMVWVFGFAIEALADAQKNAFRQDPANKDKFIQSGLWAWSRHPNYFGEITLWVGVAMVALPVLRGWQLITLISPLFVALLLTRVSGIPLLEKRADAKWGEQPEYESYKAGTSILLPLPPKTP